MQRNNSRHSKYIIALDISPAELLKYYRGSARTVLARALDGSRCRFPVDVLKPFVTHGGVKGKFALTVSQDGFESEGGKLIAIERISELPS